MMLIMSIPQFFTSETLGVASSYNPTAYMTVSIAAFVANLLVTIYQVYRIVKLKRNPLKDEIYTELKSYKDIKAENI